MNFRSLIRQSKYGILAGLMLGITYEGAVAVYWRHNATMIPIKVYDIPMPECNLLTANEQRLDSLLQYTQGTAQRELAAKGIDALQTASPKQLDEIITQSLPYIGSVLGISIVNRPQVRQSFLLSNPATYVPMLNKIVLHDYQELSIVKFMVPHELLHAQHLTGSLRETLENVYPKFTKFISLEKPKRFPRFHDESFVQFATIEVLARQALDGDTLAKLTFSALVRSSIKPNPKLHEIEGFHEYIRVPGWLMHSVLLCMRDTMEGVSFPGIRTFVNKEYDRYSGELMKHE